MLTVRFIHHGESAANAGNASSDPALIPLSLIMAWLKLDPWQSRSR
jgi:hypothetical protein